MNARKDPRVIARTGRFRVGVLSAALILAGCGDEKPTDPPVTMQPTFASIQSELFTPSCATSGCHDANQMEGGISLEAADSYASLFGTTPSTRAAADSGMLRVDPGNPGNSFLILKLRGPDPVMGRQMPYNGPFLRDAEIDVIETWILNGALP